MKMLKLAFNVYAQLPQWKSIFYFLPLAAKTLSGVWSPASFTQVATRTRFPSDFSYTLDPPTAGFRLHAKDDRLSCIAGWRKNCHLLGRKIAPPRAPPRRCCQQPTSNLREEIQIKAGRTPHPTLNL